MSIGSLLTDPEICWHQHPRPYSKKSSSHFKSLSLQDDKQVQFSDLPHISSITAKQTSSKRRVTRSNRNRLRYDEEEIWFVWYKRVALRQPWDDILDSFNRQFPNRRRLGTQGIECMCYRGIEEKDYHLSQGRTASVSLKLSETFPI
ncbi:hypothetical protein N7455_009265 [Penicillium solitum]|uniref:uncharacterized protein n=1 Tax=Penicillium solitum TaxID=60172 RepID=UPI0032C44120|nr:hypothetical protein N7455_009265 [Penicillium solitum]